jgi:hypothetical protein
LRVSNKNLNQNENGKENEEKEKTGLVSAVLAIHTGNPTHYDPDTKEVLIEWGQNGENYKIKLTPFERLLGERLGKELTDKFEELIDLGLGETLGLYPENERHMPNGYDERMEGIFQVVKWAARHRFYSEE